MWLIDVHTKKLEYFEGSNAPPYAILSHRWEADEVSHQDMLDGSFYKRKGYIKIDRCCVQASQDHLHYAWVDTCCIDKKSSAELSEAINSMYGWYKRSKVCYAFLSDISDSGVANYEKAASSLWFSRGWTLQELLAPRVVRFYTCDWGLIAERNNSYMSEAITISTGIPIKALQGFDPDDWSIAQKMSWASERKTTRIEDQAYCLLGLFDVFIPMLYGEGERAFARLQEELSKMSDDRSIFAWSGRPARNLAMFAASSNAFKESGRIGKCRLQSNWYSPTTLNRFTLFNDGLLMMVNLLPLYPGYFAALIGLHYHGSQGQPLVLIFRSPPGSLSSTNDTGRLFERVTLDGRGFVALDSPEPFIELPDGLKELPNLAARYGKRNVMAMVSRHTKGQQVVRKPYNIQGFFFHRDYYIFDPHFMNYKHHPPLRGDQSVVLSVDWHKANSFLGCFYGFSDQFELMALTLGLDFENTPIGVWQKWPQDMTHDLRRRFRFRPGEAMLRISKGSTKQNLLSCFEAALEKNKDCQSNLDCADRGKVRVCLFRCSSRNPAFPTFENCPLRVNTSDDGFSFWATGRSLSEFGVGQVSVFNILPATIENWLSTAYVPDAHLEHPYFSYLNATLQGLAIHSVRQLESEAIHENTQPEHT